MDLFIVARICKPLLMFVITFLSVRYISGSVTDGFLVALIPLILGSINVSAKLGYGITAIALICAIGWAVTPHLIRDTISTIVAKQTTSTIKDVRQSQMMAGKH